MAERRERVVLELQDDFSTPMARAAATTALLKRELNSLSGTAIRGASRDLDGVGKSATKAGTEIEKTGASADRSGKEIDKYSGRLRLLTDAALSIGPALIPLGAAAIPAIAGLAAGMGAAAGAAGVAVLAFHGLGDGLKAIDAYQIEPTTENLQKMQAALENLGPAGAQFARYLDDLEPQLKGLQNIARAGLFPGIEDGINSLMTVMPEVRQIVNNVATEMGKLASEAGAGLAGGGFSEFLDYLKTDAATTLAAFAHSIGNVAEGLGHLTVAFAPLSRDFASGMESMTKSFADWADGLSQTQGFHDFVDYIRESGPMIGHLLGAVSEAFVAIVRAAAPMGQVVVPVLTALAQTLTAIANSPIGPELFTAAAGFVALNRASSLLGPGLRSLSDAFTDLRTSPNMAATAMQRFSGVARVAAGAGGMALFVSSLHEANSNLRTFEGVAGGALAGLAVGGPWGAAIGGSIGLLSSFGAANVDAAKYVGDLTASLDAQTGALTESSRAVAAKALEDAGVLKIADQLGVGLDTVTSAALGNKGAMAEVNAELVKFQNVDTPAGVDVEMFKQREAGNKLVSTLKQLAGNSDSTVAAQVRIASAAGTAGAAFSRQTKQMQAARAAAATTANSFITLGKSLNEAKVSLGDWISDLAKQADALRNFGNNAATAARRGLDLGLIKSLQKAGPEGALRMKQLADATDEQIARASAAWRRGQREIRNYGKTAGGLRPVNLDVDTARMQAKMDRAILQLRKYGLSKPQAALLLSDLASGKIKNVQQLVNQYGLSKKAATALLNDLASGRIRGIQALLNSLHDKTVTINTVHNDSFISKRVGQATSAEGGSVPKTGLPYADRHPYLLADGEEVTSNRYGQADAFRPVLKAINANLPRSIIKGMLADGGTVGLASGGTAGSTQSAVDTSATQRALSGLRHRLEESQAALKAETDDLKNLRSARNELRSGISTGLRSDIFDTSNPWAASSGPFGTLKSDIARGRHFDALIKTLKGKGVDGSALAEIISSGDVQRAEMMASMSRSSLNSYERLYNTREHVLAAAGAAGGQAVYGAEIRAQTREVRQLRQEVHHIQAAIRAKTKQDHKSRQDAAKTTADGVNDAAKSGHRRGSR